MHIDYTGGIAQQLDTDMHSTVTAKTSTALWQRKRAQHCDSENEHSAVAAKTSVTTQKAKGRVVGNVY